VDHAREPFDTGLVPSDLRGARPRPLETPWGSFFLVELEGELAAIESWCPHLAAPLFQGSFHGDRVTCPWHGWVFSLRTGACVWTPETGGARDTRLFRLEVGRSREGTLVILPPPPGHRPRRRWSGV